MKFENISTEEDFRTGQLRMAVLWEKEDVERFGDFFKQDMVDVVQIISDGGVVGALVSPQPPSEPASTDEYYVVDEELLDNLFIAHRGGQWPEVLRAIEALADKFEPGARSHDHPPKIKDGE